jgi:hypothetical protein
MNLDPEIQRAIANGQRNQAAKELIHNWCRHARVEKFGGIGLIEAQTGLPIGHHAMVCDFATIQTGFQYSLEDAALQFHDANCVGCSKREHVALPNLTKLLAQRERDQELAQLQAEDIERKKNEALRRRTDVRTGLRQSVSLPVATFIDDLQSLDESHDADAATRLVESVRLAPELLIPELEDHLFSLLEGGEHWFTSTGLRILADHARDLPRLIRCAMKCLAKGVAIDDAAEIILGRVAQVDAGFVSDAVIGLAYVASPPRPEYHLGTARPDKPEALFRVAARFPEETARGFDTILDKRDARLVGVGARALGLLIAKDAFWAKRFVRLLAVELSRADVVVDIDRDSELRGFTNDLMQALSNAFLQDPEWVDGELMRQFESASADGEGRLAGVYDHVLRRAEGGRGKREKITNLAPYKVAIKRSVHFAEISENESVTQHVLDALRYPDASLAPVAKELMDLLLGTAAVLNSKLEEPSTESPIIAAPDWLRAMEQSNRRSTLWYLRSGFIAMAIQGALLDADGLASFESFLAKRGGLGDSLAAAVIKETAPLMQTGTGLRAVLPHLYAAMVGPSTLGRAAAAKAIEEMGSSRFKELPELVAEAFLLMLLDPYVIVHKATVKALRRITLPKWMDQTVMAALDNLIVVYRAETDQEFLLECIEAKTGMKREDALFAASDGKVLLAIVNGIKPSMLLRNGHYFFLEALSGVEGYAQFALGLFRHCQSDYETDHALDIVDDIPAGTSGDHAAAFVAVMETDPLDVKICGTFIELLTRDGCWEGAFRIARIRVDAIPSTPRERAQKLHAQQLMWRVEFEHLVSQGEIEAALVVGKSWQTAEREIKEIHDRQEKSDPFRSLLRSTSGQ